MFKTRLLTVFLVVFFLQTAIAQTDSLLLRLRSLPDVVDVTPIRANTLFKSAYVIMVDQPVDHDKPNGKHFHQRVFLSHVDFSKPMIFVTEGYQADYAQNSRYTEGTQIFWKECSLTT
jgi:hypothetical protein